MKKITVVKIMPLTLKIKRYWRSLGPGLITGASDDDPSGIATYSQAGASFGLATLWTALITFPLMAAVQEMCARIGLVTHLGLAAVIKNHYPKPILYCIVFITIPAIVFNIAADIAGMGAVATLIFPNIPSYLFSSIFTLFLMLGISYFSYKNIASIMKWLCVALIVYLVIPFLVKNDWGKTLEATVFPTIHWNKEFFTILIAILGTTISPYLFFWQTSMSLEDKNHKIKLLDDTEKELREMRLDVNSGMFFSNLVMYFIILTTGVVLFAEGVHVTTVKEAAEALKPLVGEFAYLLFTLGIIGTGFLAIPVLAGSLGYILADIRKWKQGMDHQPREAKEFYFVILFSMLLGLIINFLGINPIDALVYTAFVYGTTAPVLILLIIHICNNKKIMGKFTNGLLSNLLGVICFLLLASTAIALFFV